MGSSTFTPRKATSIIGLNKFYKLADYITINISSPNTENLRDFHNLDELGNLLDKIFSEKKN